MVVFYVPGLLFNWPSLPRIVAAIVAIVINYSVYFSEIFRAGYQSISKGQKEAGFVLGLSRIEIFFKVQLLQIIKKIMPPMTNETISLVKDTALARIIAVNEVMLAADKIVGTYANVWVLFYTAIFYLVVVGIISLLFKGVEKKLNYFEG
jgi:polar amino acid transport system permease protein